MKQYLGKVFPILGKYLINQYILALKPSSKSTPNPSENIFSESEETNQLRSMVSLPLNLSSTLPKMLKIADDVSSIIFYGSINNIERPVYRCYSEPFLNNPKELSIEFSSLLNEITPEMKELLFNDDQLQALNIFILSFT